jgi:hypothetical protein
MTVSPSLVVSGEDDIFHFWKHSNLNLQTKFFRGFYYVHMICII